MYFVPVAILKLFCKLKEKQFAQNTYTNHQWISCQLLACTLLASIEHILAESDKVLFKKNPFFLSRCPCRSLRFLSSHFFTFISHCTFCGRWLDSWLIRFFYFRRNSSMYRTFFNKIFFCVFIRFFSFKKHLLVIIFDLSEKDLIFLMNSVWVHT